MFTAKAIALGENPDGVASRLHRGGRGRREHNQGKEEPRERGGKLTKATTKQRARWRRPIVDSRRGRESALGRQAEERGEGGRKKAE